MSPRNFLFISEQNKAYFSAGNKNNQITKHISIISAVKIEQTKKKTHKIRNTKFSGLSTFSCCTNNISSTLHLFL